jgi:hypothetical protein
MGNSIRGALSVSHHIDNIRIRRSSKEMTLVRTPGTTEVIVPFEFVYKACHSVSRDMDHRANRMAVVLFTIARDPDRPMSVKQRRSTKDDKINAGRQG